MVSRVKELREALNMSQKELSERVNVSRQTIYHLEKGTYNPRMDLSLKLRETLGKPVEEIFSLEPIIQDLIGKKTTNELEEISRQVGIAFEGLYKLKSLEEDQLLKKFTENQLKKIANAFGVDFEELFIE
jgi:putative transcriptional regulator